MRIAYITAGAGGMYCGSCLSDNTLAAALIDLGHEATLIPTYTPIRTDETDVSVDRVFYGAINVYLAQKLAPFRHTPRALGRWLDSRRLLAWVSRLAATVDARSLGPLTLSMLQGEHGRQRKELARLIVWLGESLRPDIVHLTNSLLLGLAGPIRRELGVPVLCSVQGEDLFLEQLAEPHRSRVRAVLRERARDVDGFVAGSRYYAELMSGYLGVPLTRMHCIPLGISLAGHESGDLRRPERPFVIGYLARICPEKGLHLLVEALVRLAGEVGRERVRLAIAGYLGERDRAYFDRVMERLRSAGLEDVTDYRGEVDRQGKIDFLSGIHVLSVPTTYREPKGRFVLEALASGVPVVEPRHGAFPELIAATGGGMLVEPDSPAALAAALRELMDDPARREALGRAGRQAVIERYSDRAMAERTLRHYEAVIANQAPARAESL